MKDCRQRRRRLEFPKLRSRKRPRCRRAWSQSETDDAQSHNDHVHNIHPQHPAGGMARVPPSTCFLLPSPNIGHRLFTPDMFRNVGRRHDVHQRYFPSGCAKRLLISSHTVTFDKDSHGQLAAVIYEWSDVDYLGKVTSYVDDLPVSVGVRHPATNAY